LDNGDLVEVERSAPDVDGSGAGFDIFRQGIDMDLEPDDALART
jgi:hypothetical protein